jgi:hypothetical protein
MTEVESKWLKNFVSRSPTERMGERPTDNTGRTGRTTGR